MKNIYSAFYRQLTFTLFLILCLSLANFAQQPGETPPPPSEAPTVNIPEVREMTLPNGLK